MAGGRKTRKITWTLNEPNATQMNAGANGPAEQRAINILGNLITLAMLMFVFIVCRVRFSFSYVCSFMIEDLSESVLLGLSVFVL